MAHIQQEVCHLPSLQKGVVAYRRTYQDLVGDDLEEKNLREKCVNDYVRKMVGNIENLN
jgi:hypothetical protein